VRLLGEAGVHLDELFDYSYPVVHKILLASMLLIIAISLPGRRHEESRSYFRRRKKECVMLGQLPI
jgi:hypothetical protein